MSLIATNRGTTPDPCPAGVHNAVCVDLIDNGLVVQEFGGKKRELHKCTVRWQVAEINPATGKRFTVQKRYTVSLNEKATLRKDLESWRGKPFTKDELAGFDLEALIGSGCQLGVVQSPGRQDPSKVYANAQTIMALGRGMAPLVTEDYVREKDREPAQSTEPTPAEDDEIAF